MVICDFSFQASYFILFSGIYYLSEFDGSCADLGYRTIVTENECRSAVSEIKQLEPNATFQGVHEDADWPKGCYLFVHSVYFNTHQTGSVHIGQQSRQICTHTGTFYETYYHYLINMKDLFIILS